MDGAITFDFHNTLVRCDEWFELEVRTLPKRVGEILGLPSPENVTDIYRDLRKNVIAEGIEIDATAGVVETWRRAGVSIEPALVDPVVDDLMRHLVSESTLLVGVNDALNAARNSGARLGVVSSAVHHDFLEWALAWHEVDTYFDVIVTSASAGFYKSRPEIYQIALGLLSAHPEHSVHVGDSYRFDHLTGSSLGMRTIWLNESGQDVPTDSQTPDVVIQSMSEISGALTQLFGNEVSVNAV